MLSQSFRHFVQLLLKTATFSSKSFRYKKSSNSYIYSYLSRTGACVFIFFRSFAICRDKSRDKYLANNHVISSLLSRDKQSRLCKDRFTKPENKGNQFLFSIGLLLLLKTALRLELAYRVFARTFLRLSFVSRATCMSYVHTPASAALYILYLYLGRIFRTMYRERLAVVCRTICTGFSAVSDIYKYT